MGFPKAQPGEARLATVSIASTATSTQIVPSDPTRTFIAIENSDANVLYLLFGPGAASPTNYTVSLSSGDYFEVPHVACGFAMNGVWSADGTGTALVTTI
jgi:hypothetical protein